MATKTLDFTGAKYPDLTLGLPVFGGFRHYIIFDGKVTLAVDDSISVRWNIPGNEYWRLRAAFVSDSTKGATQKGQGWEEQRIQLETAGAWRSGEATTAAPRPVVPYTKSIPAKYPVWWRQWDGVTFLAFQDANAVILPIHMKDPTFDITVFPPGSIWDLAGLHCEFASTGDQPFDTHILVDRYIMPANLVGDEEAMALWFRNIQLAQLLQGQG